MRNTGRSLRKTAAEFGIDPRVVAHLGSSALRKGKDGRYKVRKQDRLLRVLAVPGRKGIREIALRDSRQASKVGRYWDAVQKYLRTGDASALKEFRGVRIVGTSRKRIRLITDPNELNRLAHARVLSFESIYARLV